MKQPEAKINKSAWIREQPAKISAADMVSATKAAGIKLTVAQVYTVRSNAKKTGGRSKPGPKPRERQLANVDDRTSDQHFMSVVLDMGFSKADALLQRVRAHLREL